MLEGLLGTVETMKYMQLSLFKLLELEMLHQDEKIKIPTKKFWTKSPRCFLKGLKRLLTLVYKPRYNAIQGSRVH